MGLQVLAVPLCLLHYCDDSVESCRSKQVNNHRSLTLRMLKAMLMLLLEFNLRSVLSLSSELVSWFVCRVEMTLKEQQGGSWTDMGDLKKGDVVKGRIKRLEAFGAFVELHNSTLTGLAHISEVSDDFIKTLEDSFQVGQGTGVCVHICL